MKLINATKTVTYNYDEIAGYIAESECITVEEVTLEQVMDWVQDYVAEDFSYSGDVDYFDEDGNVIRL